MLFVNMAMQNRRLQNVEMLFVNMAMQNRCLQNVEMLFVFSSNWAADLSFEYAFCQVGDTACQRAFLFKHWSETD